MNGLSQVEKINIANYITTLFLQYYNNPPTSIEYANSAVLIEYTIRVAGKILSIKINIGEFQGYYIMFYRRSEYLFNVNTNEFDVIDFLLKKYKSVNINDIYDRIEYIFLMTRPKIVY